MAININGCWPWGAINNNGSQGAININGCWGAINNNGDGAGVPCIDVRVMPADAINNNGTWLPLLLMAPHLPSTSLAPEAMVVRVTCLSWHVDPLILMALEVMLVSLIIMAVSAIDNNGSECH